MRGLTTCTIVCALAIHGGAQPLFGHGTPILLGTDGTHLVVSGGLSDTDGFVSQIFVEDDEDGDGQLSPGPVPNVGHVVLWEIPGFHISGLDPSSSLALEVLARPVLCCDLPEERTLWYWNAADGVVAAESEAHLLGIGLRFQTISPEDTATLPAFSLVDEVGGTAAQGGEQGFHNHGLLTYALDHNTPPAAGAYGFFARMTSGAYEPSDPFLVLLNYGVDYERMVEAALAINRAAGDPLAGDFNNDCVVDAADYIVWRRAMGSQADYNAWRGNFGEALVFEGGDAAGNAVPEPRAALLLAIGLGFAGARRLDCRIPRGYFGRCSARARRLASSRREV